MTPIPEEKPRLERLCLAEDATGDFEVDDVAREVDMEADLERLHSDMERCGHA